MKSTEGKFYHSEIPLQGSYIYRWQIFYLIIKEIFNSPNTWPLRVRRGQEHEKRIHPFPKRVSKKKKKIDVLKHFYLNSIIKGSFLEDLHENGCGHACVCPRGRVAPLTNSPSPDPSEGSHFSRILPSGQSKVTDSHSVPWR